MGAQRMSNTVHVKLFAMLREKTGIDELDIALPQDATIQQLWEKLISLYPQLAQYRTFTRVAINQKFATDNAPIPANAEVALIPPVSGG